MVYLEVNYATIENYLFSRIIVSQLLQTLFLQLCISNISMTSNLAVMFF